MGVSCGQRLRFVVKTICVDLSALSRLPIFYFLSQCCSRLRRFCRFLDARTDSSSDDIIAVSSENVATKVSLVNGTSVMNSRYRNGLLVAALWHSRLYGIHI